MGCHCDCRSVLLFEQGATKQQRHRTAFEPTYCTSTVFRHSRQIQRRWQLRLVARGPKAALVPVRSSRRCPSQGVRGSAGGTFRRYEYDANDVPTRALRHERSRDRGGSSRGSVQVMPPRTRFDFGVPHRCETHPSRSLYLFLCPSVLPVPSRGQAILQLRDNTGYAQSIHMNRKAGSWVSDEMSRIGSGS